MTKVGCPSRTSRQRPAQGLNAVGDAAAASACHIMVMTQRRLPLLPILWALALAGAAPALAKPAQPAQLSQMDRDDLKQVTDYLQAIKSLRARFIQVSEDGQVAMGRVYLDRPNKIRFEYDPPNKLLMVASGDFLYVYDGFTNETSTLPIDSTPISFLLRDQIKLGGDVTVTGIERKAGLLTVTLRQSDRPDDGALVLTFSQSPLRLEQWTVIDAQKRATTVTLQDVETGVTFPRDLFVFNDPGAAVRQLQK